MIALRTASAASFCSTEIDAIAAAAARSAPTGAIADRQRTCAAGAALSHNRNLPSRCLQMSCCCVVDYAIPNVFGEHSRTDGCANNLRNKLNFGVNHRRTLAKNAINLRRRTLLHPAQKFPPGVPVKFSSNSSTVIPFAHA